LNYTLDRNELRGLFRIVTVEDVKNPKPAPDGLLKLLEGRDPGVALYIGDNVDDALAAQSAKVPFVGVLPRSSHARRERGPGLDELGALAILADVNELEDWLRTSVDRPRSIGLKHSRRAQTSANC
jgi:phosphoglycolate phosphatase-like HAD superfamily hydrolase